MPSKSHMRWLERGLMATGSAAALIFLWYSVPAVLAHVQTSATSSASATDGPVVPATVLGSAYLSGKSTVADGARIATILVPQLHLNAPVVEGVSDADLRRGVGHVPGSAFGGGLGNVVLAAHRDALFRPLRSIQRGMDIQLSGTDGTYHYQVDAMQVVAPDHLEVLGISTQPEVTLITCYPFNFIGSAPMRYVVKAHLVSPLSDEALGRQQ